MTDVIIWLLAVWGCAALFTFIGVYAGRRQKPMHFWSGTTVDPVTVRDIPGYNRAYRRMWLVYSLVYWFSGIIYVFHPMVAAAMLIMGATLGLFLMIWYYKQRIEKKYVVKK